MPESFYEIDIDDNNPVSLPNKILKNRFLKFLIEG